MTKDCPICGKTCKNEMGVSFHKASMHGAPWHDKERLREKYVDEELSTYKIAELWDCSQEGIIDAMKRHGIDRRGHDRRDHSIGSLFFANHNPTVGGVYEHFQFPELNRKILIHRLLALSEGLMNFEEFCDPSMHVHHKSGHGLDNRPGNLQVLTNSEHMSLHNSPD